MKYKLLAVDLDDTLLNEKFVISARNRAAIQKADARGIMVTLATGRMFRSALPFARELGIDLPLVTYHGALIKQAGSGNVLQHRAVPLSLALKILEYSEEQKVHVNLYLDDNLYVQEENENSAYYLRIASIPIQAVGPLPPFLKQHRVEPTKLTMIDMQADRLDAVQSELRQLFSPGLSILQSRPKFLEITHQEATKGQALRFLAEKQGIARESIVAIGDSYNDVDMLRFAGLGVAVANAPEDVKKAADLVTRANTDDGVAAFIEEYLLD